MEVNVADLAQAAQELEVELYTLNSLDPQLEAGYTRCIHLTHSLKPTA
jgi:hypothetical protein